ncbi:TolC family protein [Lonepinella sp. BR2357]|uniref:TolC family protein n=1 Tax=Lonepinella sp. BR2357 TaxID=3434549 RepID=UPI003F6DCE94
MHKLFSRAVGYPCLLLVGLSMMATEVHATSLQSILKVALSSDPTIREAQANIGVSDTQVKISKAGHLPILGVSTSRNLTHHYNDSRSVERNPVALTATVNVYSWGEISNAVERDEHKREYYQYKYDETREQLGSTIGKVYLTALYAKENIAVYQESLQRYSDILADLKVISSYDTGRTSETVEAESRRLQAESSLVAQQRILQTSLSQLSRYTGRLLSAEDIVDPFADMTVEKLKAQFTSKGQYADNPSYQAQQAELARTQSQEKVSKAKRLPALNLEGEWGKHGYEVNMKVSWNLFDPATYYSGVQDAYSAEAAKERMAEIQREVTENSQTAEISMRQSLQYLTVSKKQIQSQKNVVEIYEQQYLISRRSLLDVLDAYQSLTSIQVAEASARNDYRDAVLAYLVAQAQVSKWAGIVTLKGL